MTCFRERTRIWLHTRDQDETIEPRGVRGAIAQGIEADAVYFKKNEHDMGAEALIAVNERMIFNQAFRDGHNIFIGSRLVFHCLVKFGKKIFWTIIPKNDHRPVFLNFSCNR